MYPLTCGSSSTPRLESHRRGVVQAEFATVPPRLKSAVVALGHRSGMHHAYRPLCRNFALGYSGAATLRGGCCERGSAVGGRADSGFACGLRRVSKPAGILPAGSRAIRNQPARCRGEAPFSGDCPPQGQWRQANGLAWNSQFLHGGNTNGERREVRYT